MARISGVDIPNAKRVEVALTYIYGIGLKSARDILAKTGVNPDTRAKDLTEDDIEKSRKDLESCDILLLQLESPIPSVLKAAKIAHQAGKTVVLNPAPACPLPEEIFRNIDLFIPNETELSTFSGMPVTSQEEAQAAAKAMQAKGVGKLIVTMGSKGALICEGGPSVFVPAHKVKAVDTTAAGDTFCGALCVAISEGKSLKEAAEFACAASALTVQKMGAQNAIPYRKDL